MFLVKKNKYICKQQWWAEAPEASEEQCKVGMSI